MALTDILAAITASTDEKISMLRKEHKDALSDLRTATEADVERIEADVTERKEAKKTALRTKTTLHAESLLKNAELNEKQKQLNTFYTALVKHLSTLPAKQLEPLFKEWLKNVPADATIHPAEAHADALKAVAKDHKIGATIKAQGGFIAAKGATELDYTFETVVKEQIRPQSELHASQALFA